MLLKISVFLSSLENLEHLAVRCPAPYTARIGWNKVATTYALNTPPMAGRGRRQSLRTQALNQMPVESEMVLGCFFSLGMLRDHPGITIVFPRRSRPGEQWQEKVKGNKSEGISNCPFISVFTVLTFITTIFITIGEACHLTEETRQTHRTKVVA